MGSISTCRRFKLPYCTPSRIMPDYARVTAEGINTVDCYDIHHELADLRIELDKIARANRAVAVVSAGGIRELIQLFAACFNSWLLVD